MKRASNKARSRSGFTLAETLLTVLILLLVSGIVATGVPVAQNVFNKTIVAANAQVLLSTAVSTLRDELGTAWDVKADGNAITYNSADTGAPARIYLETTTTPAVIKLQEYAPWAAIGTPAEDKKDNKIASEHPLVSEALSTKQKLSLVYTSVTCANGVATFTGLAVYHNGSTTPLAKLDTLNIRVFSVDSAAPSGGT